MELYYAGFLDLTSSRAITGFGIGPISWLVIEQYCKAKELDENQTEAMHHHIVEMDKAYMKHQQKKNK